MRTAFASLIIAAGLAGVAQAQVQAPAAPAAPAPAPAPAAAAPAPAAAQPATPSPAAPEPTLPTGGDGAAIISILDKVCVPAVKGQGVDAAAKAAGLKANKRDGTWTLQLGGARDYVVIVQPQYSNRDVCSAEVRYAVGQDKAIVSAVNVWAFLHKPELVLQANYVNVDADGVKRIRKSWEHAESNASTAVNFSILRKPDDSPLNPKYDTGMLFYQERKF